MLVSIFDLFKIGIGPSSSHTVGPMNAANLFAEKMRDDYSTKNIKKITITLFGSLAFTGKGHGTDKAVQLGLAGYLPENIDPDKISGILDSIMDQKLITINGISVSFNPKSDIVFDYENLHPYHSNALLFRVFDSSEKIILEQLYYSVGGGFVVTEDSIGHDLKSNVVNIPYNFSSADELLYLCKENNKTIKDIVIENELAIKPAIDLNHNLDEIWNAMDGCIKRGLKNEHQLPGGLNVNRRAPDLFKALKNDKKNDPLKMMDWVNVWAIAVNEENAGGGRVVTAPTNGAAGIIPAVIKYYSEFIPYSNIDGIHDFILTAGAIGILYKKNASISGAEVGCQGEVGVACSMAAAGLTAALGGTTEQIENAAEIGMEHNLGLTCDPVGGLVQIPCIERNAMGAVKAINASRIAMVGSGQHVVSLDQVIQTMNETGKDMKTKYKETAQGGLAVNVVEC